MVSHPAASSVQAKKQHTIAVSARFGGVVLLFVMDCRSLYNLSCHSNDLSTNGTDESLRDKCLVALAHVVHSSAFLPLCT